jgi:hypothetical protein
LWSVTHHKSTAPGKIELYIAQRSITGAVGSRTAGGKHNQ